MRTRIIPIFAGSVILASSLALLIPAAAQAAVACDEASLVAAINLANSSGGGTGNANVITRSASAPAFRIAEVSVTGSLTLNSVTLSNGSSLSGDGGGILNFGSVTVDSGGLTDNTAAGNGGGIATGPGSGAAATFSSSTLSGNTATTGSGGAVYSQGGTATLTSSTATRPRWATEAVSPPSTRCSPSPAPRSAPTLPTLRGAAAAAFTATTAH